MLGEKIGELSGKITARRVLPNPGGTPHMETSFEASGKMLELEIGETPKPGAAEEVAEGSPKKHGKKHGAVAKKPGADKPGKKKGKGKKQQH